MRSIGETDWGEQDEHGVDLARLRHNLSLTWDQRLERHQQAARFVLECMRAAETSRGTSTLNSIDLFKHQANLAFKDFRDGLDGVSEGLSWARLPQHGKDFLHTDGSIFGITLHVAVCKKMYGSVGFKESEIRWRDCAEQVAKIEPSWTAALAYLEEAQTYWMSSWEGLSGADLDDEHPHFSGCLRPAWKLIHTVVHHDGYHGGQIGLLRYGCAETSEHPESVAEDIRTHCSQLPDW